ncbi:MAG: hypothetical protein K5989_12560, partial [Lachnospiraceae bacterium]|nr:hypothetical protein [Lachnospiraceae bacterium]
TVSVNSCMQDTYVENQTTLSSLRYGVKTFDYCGCAVAAMYNALSFLSGKADRNLLPLLISRFEESGAAFSARFGTAPRSAAQYLSKYTDFSFEKSGNPKKFREIAEKSDALIYTFFNNKKKISRQVHTICITKENGQYIAHNSHNRREVYDSPEQVLQNVGDAPGLAAGIYLVGILSGRGDTPIPDSGLR